MNLRKFQIITILCGFILFLITNSNVQAQNKSELGGTAFRLKNTVIEQYIKIKQVLLCRNQ